jgi:hypothetical protein
VEQLVLPGLAAARTLLQRTTVLRNMKTRAIWAVATLLAAAFGVQGPCLAGELGMTPKALGILSALADAAVPPTELSRQHGRGLNVDTNYTFDGALSNGALRGNAVIGPSDTGSITTTGSINNNTGITTVFQNSGNNSLFQQTTSINITVH